MSGALTREWENTDATTTATHSALRRAMMQSNELMSILFTPEAFANTVDAGCAVRIASVLAGKAAPHDASGKIDRLI